jgi:hypothetical protein
LVFEQAVAALRSAGLSVSDLVEEEGVVEGTIESEKVKSLEKLIIVEYVRCVFSYLAHDGTGGPEKPDVDDTPEAEDADDAGA